jgi:hypothetical protein
MVKTSLGERLYGEKKLETSQMVNGGLKHRNDDINFTHRIFVISMSSLLSQNAI